MRTPKADRLCTPELSYGFISYLELTWQGTHGTCLGNINSYCYSYEYKVLRGLNPLLQEWTKKGHGCIPPSIIQSSRFIPPYSIDSIRCRL